MGFSTILLNIAVDNPYFHKILGGFINEQVETKTNVNLEFKALSLQFFPPGFDVYGVSIRDDKGEDIFSSSRLQIRVSLVSLLLGKPRLSLLKLSELRARYPFPDNLIKPSNKDEQVETSSEHGIIWPPEFDLPIDHISLSNATIDIRHAPKSGPTITAQLDGLNLDFDFADWDRWDTTIDLNRLNLVIGKAHLLKDAKLNLDLENKDYNIRSKAIQLSSPRIDLSASGIIESEIKQEKLDIFRDRKLINYRLLGLKIKKNIQLHSGDTAILGDYLGVEDSDGKLSGDLELTSQISFSESLSDWRIKGEVHSKNARLAGFKLLHSHAKLVINQEEIRFPSIVIREQSDSTTHLAKARGKIQFLEGVPYDFNLSLNRASLADVLDTVKVSNFTALKANIRSKKLVLRGTSNPFSMTLNGPATFEQLSLSAQKAGYRYPSPDCDFNIDFRINSKRLMLDQNMGLCYRDDLQPPTIIGPFLEDQIDQGKSPLILHGPIYFAEDQGMNLSLTSPKIEGELFEHFIESPLQGKLNLKSAILGPYNNLKVTAEASGFDTKILGFPSKKLDINAEYQINKRNLLIHKLVVEENSESYLKLVDSSLDTDKFIFKGKIESYGLREPFIKSGLQTLFPDQNIEFGIKSLVGHFKVPISKPMLWEGDLNFAISNASISGKKYFTLIEGSVLANKRKITSRDLYYRLDLMEVDIDYNEIRTPLPQPPQTKWEKLGLNFQNKIKIALKSRQRTKSHFAHKDFDPLNHMASLPYIGKSLSDLKTGGDIDVQAKLEGSYLGLEGSFTGNFYKAVALGSPIAPIQFSGFIKENKIEIPIIKHAGNSLVGRLSLDLKGDQIPFKWYFFLEQFDGRAFLSPFFSKDPRNYAYITADWSMEGDLHNWWNATGYLNISKIESQFVKRSDNNLQKIEVNSSEPIRLAFSPNSWSFKDRKSLSLKSQDFSLNIGLDGNNPPDQIQLSTSGHVDLKILKKLSPMIETSTGKVTFNGNIGGSVTEPKINIDLQSTGQEGDEISIGFVDFSPTFTDINLNASITDNAIIIRQLNGSKGSRGSFKIKGNWDLLSERREDSQIFINLNEAELQRFPIPIFKTADATISGDITVAGRTPPFSVTGNILVNEATSQTNFDLRKELVSSIRQSKFEAPVNDSEPLLKFDLSINSDEKISISNKNLDVRLSSDLTLRGNEQKPIILGQIESKEGIFKYRRDFRIVRGVVSFEEPNYPPDPRLDVIGEAEILAEGTNYIAQILINGKASDTNVTLTIDPPTKPDGSAFSKIDIILLMTTGRLPSSDSNTPSNFLENEALSLFVGYAEGPLEKIFDLTGQQYIRQIYIDTYLPATIEDPQPVARLNVPVRLTDDLSLILQLDHAENFKASFQYSLHQKITVSGSFDERNEEKIDDSNLPADTAVDLKFKFNFE